MDTLKIRGARQHNLKNVDLDVPKYKLVVFTGLSGSGKSSLAFDTIYAEGQRRYVESLSSYARQFLGIMDKPDVDSIEGLSPAISIDQKSTSHNPRSTVGTVTEIYDYLRLLFARVGHPHCPNCGREISRQTPQQIVDGVIRFATETLKSTANRQVRFMILAPVVRDRKGEFSTLLTNLRQKGIRQARVDGRYMGTDEDLILIKTNKHTIEAIHDRITIAPKDLKDAGLPLLRTRLNDAVEQALLLSDGIVVVSEVKDASFDFPEKPKETVDHTYSEKFSCPVCNISFPEIEPRTFSFNSPHGACSSCTGLGSVLTVDPTLVFKENLTILEGGILPFASMFMHDTWFSRVVATVCDTHGIDPRTPIAKLSDKHKQILLEGTGEQIYRVTGTNRQGESTAIHEPYRGVVGELKMRHSQTESEFVRAEIEKYMRDERCTACDGKRLKKESLTVTIADKSIADVTDMSITRGRSWMDTLTSPTLSQTEMTISTPIVKEIKSRLQFLANVGLEYLTLSRSATTLSGGEAQRIRLASQIGSGLSGVLYILDEPSIGLHQRDNQKLIDTLEHLRNLGNTVIVVEHDRDMMEAADFLVDFGPGAGVHGGAIVAAGPSAEVKKVKHSVTAQFLRGDRTISRNRHAHADKPERWLELVDAHQNNLKHVNLSIPLGLLTCVTGVSGSGKSTLVVETLYKALEKQYNPLYKDKPGVFKELKGLKELDKVVLVDQSPIGRTPRSNPATYIGMFQLIRDLYANMPDAKVRGYQPGRFSFNVKGGRCEACEGEGQRKIEMQFLSDVYVTCEVCHGRRYNSETLEVEFHGKNIGQVLEMTAEEAKEFFTHQPLICRKAETLVDVGLGYVKLGQPAPTLSGGEAQRIKLASELSRKATGRTIYILDEPTTGLHFADIDKLLAVLHKLSESGNTILVIEHNLDVIKNADWVVDLGPEGGDGGGEILVAGPPELIAKTTRSHTGSFLKELF